MHYKRKEYLEAYEWFKIAAQSSSDTTTHLLLSCAAEYAWLMSICDNSEKVSRTVKFYYTTDIVDKVHEVLKDPDQSLIKSI